MQCAAPTLPLSLGHHHGAFPRGNPSERLEDGSGHVCSSRWRCAVCPVAKYYAAVTYSSSSNKERQNLSFCKPKLSAAVVPGRHILNVSIKSIQLLAACCVISCGRVWCVLGSCAACILRGDLLIPLLGLQRLSHPLTAGAYYSFYELP